jgi:death on curing protein
MTKRAPGTEYLSVEDLLDLTTSLRVGPVRDLGLLESACHRPQASFFGQEAYPTLGGKAAALMHSVVGNHALVDGNKRLGFLATAVFLRINGYSLELTDDEAFDLTMSVAAGQLDVAGIEKRLRLAQLSGREPSAASPATALAVISGNEPVTRAARPPRRNHARAERRSRGRGNEIER